MSENQSESQSKPVNRGGWGILYRLLLVVARPWVRVRLRLRARKDPEYGRRVAERFADLPETLPRGAVWFHTVSAGETIAAAPVIERLVEAFPETPFLVTTMTPTGSAQVAKLLGGKVAHCYAPYDFPDVVERFFTRMEPRLLVLMETELWPNMLSEAHRRSVPALLVNARLSERSAAGYAKLGGLVRSMLAELKFIACQYPAHAERFRSLGASPSRLGVLGSVKFDVILPPDHEARVNVLAHRWRIESRPVWIAGSTHPGEESVVLEAHQRLQARVPEALLILVPRHPDRREEVGSLIDRAGFSQARMSDQLDPSLQEQPGTPELDVILGDTMGELLYLYGLADVAFLGGSLVSVGGHNPIEAAVCKVPLIMGPQTFNFPDVVAAFSEAGCLSLATDAQTLSALVADYLSDTEGRKAAGAAAARVVAENTGAMDRLLELLTAEIRAAAASRRAQL